MKYFAALVLAVSVLLTGCGGGGGSTPASPFAGSWAGVMGFTDASGGGGGAAGTPSDILLSVDSKGHLAGSWTDAGGGGALSGSVTNGGTMTLNVQYPGSPPSVTFTKGITNIASDGTWQGTLPDVGADSVGQSAVFQVARQ